MFYCRFRQVVENFEIPIIENENQQNVTYHLSPPGAKV